MLPLPKNTPKNNDSQSAPIFNIVKIFCVKVPCLTPRQWSPDKSNTTAMEKSVPTVALMGIHGSGIEKIRSCEPRNGKKNDTKPFNITARKAIAPEKVTRNEDQPDKKSHQLCRRLRGCRYSRPPRRACSQTIQRK